MGMGAGVLPGAVSAFPAGGVGLGAAVHGNPPGGAYGNAGINLGALAHAQAQGAGARQSGGWGAGPGGHGGVGAGPPAGAGAYGKGGAAGYRPNYLDPNGQYGGGY